MSRAAAALTWLDAASDRLSPIVVKEVRQIVRSREFYYSFTASLVVAQAVAFYGASDAISSHGTSGSGTFTALMVCLTLLGLLVVPIGAFSALRAERMEQTLELVTITALSPRRIVTGKLIAQAVKLTTLFAALAPFMAMSFLLGGIDFVTILLSLGVVFLWSLWASAVFLFLSTLFTSRAMSAVVFGAAGILVFLVVTIGRFSFVLVGGGFMAPADFWWSLAMIMTGCLATTANLVLLAENRVAVPTENRVTPLRIGFFAQFLLILAWALSFSWSTPTSRTNAAAWLGIIGGLHLALVAVFTVTEDLRVPRRVLIELSRRRWRAVLTPLRPGGGRGALYVLLQMALLAAACAFLDRSMFWLRWSIALSGYICFFTGVPAVVWWWLRPDRPAAFPLRVTILVLVALSTALPDVVYQLVSQPATLDLDFGIRHLVNPFRTLATWSKVESSGWTFLPSLLGFIGLVAWVSLINLGARATERQEEELAGAVQS